MAAIVLIAFMYVCELREGNNSIRRCDISGVSMYTPYIYTCEYVKMVENLNHSERTKYKIHTYIHTFEF